MYGVSVATQLLADFFQDGLLGVLLIGHQKRPVPPAEFAATRHQVVEHIHDVSPRCPPRPLHPAIQQQPWLHGHCPYPHSRPVEPPHPVWPPLQLEHTGPQPPWPCARVMGCHFVHIPFIDDQANPSRNSLAKPRLMQH